MLASPELYYLLTVELGWTADEYRNWLTDLLQTELLAPRTRATAGDEPAIASGPQKSH